MPRIVPSTEFVDGDQARELLPILAADIEETLYEPNSQDIDVAGFPGVRASLPHRRRDDPDFVTGSVVEPSQRPLRSIEAGDRDRRRDCGQRSRRVG